MAYKHDEDEWHDDEHETMADRKYADRQREEEGYDTLETPTRKSHGRMKRIARGEEEDYARTSAGYIAELEEIARKYDD